MGATDGMQVGRFVGSNVGVELVGLKLEGLAVVGTLDGFLLGLDDDGELVDGPEVGELVGIDGSKVEGITVVGIALG